MTHCGTWPPAPLLCVLDSVLLATVPRPRRPYWPTRRRLPPFFALMSNQSLAPTSRCAGTPELERGSPPRRMSSKLAGCGLVEAARILGARPCATVLDRRCRAEAQWLFIWVGRSDKEIVLFFYNFIKRCKGSESFVINKLK
jgi:hypothetical protein